ncbi:hypothetical protein GCM10029978_059180 [Actinoallomurus acanthiterrae]
MAAMPRCRVPSPRPRNGFLAGHRVTLREAHPASLTLPALDRAAAHAISRTCEQEVVTLSPRAIVSIRGLK